MNKIIYLLLIGFMAIAGQCFSQEGEEEIFVIVEKMPEFPGGQEALDEYFEDNIQYPPRLQAEKLSGKMVVSFMVETTGEVGEIKVHEDMETCPECSDEIVRIIESMPAWEPALQRGKPVRVRFNLPVSFRSGKYKGN